MKKGKKEQRKRECPDIYTEQHKVVVEVDAGIFLRTDGGASVGNLADAD